MDPVRLTTVIRSVDLHLPELVHLVGKVVDIVVTEHADNGPGSAWDAFFASRGDDTVDLSVVKSLRDTSVT